MKVKMMMTTALLAAVSLRAADEDVLIETRPPGGVTVSAGAGREPKRVELHSSNGQVLNLEGGRGGGGGYVAANPYGRFQLALNGGRADSPLIVSSETPDEKTIAGLEEDINIMSRILEKAAGRPDEGRKAMGIHLWMTDGANRNTRNMYIEGHGALFTFNVDFPLVAPASKIETPAKKEETSSAWEETRNELFGGEDDEKTRGPQPFDPAQVARTKDAIIDALKNATHIRGLKADEFVTVVLQGSGDVLRLIQKRSGSNRIIEEMQGFAGKAPARTSTVMTFRAKKSDADAFAKGKLDLEAFKKKVTVAAYRRSAVELANEERSF